MLESQRTGFLNLFPVANYYLSISSVASMSSHFLSQSLPGSGVQAQSLWIFYSEHHRLQSRCQVLCGLISLHGGETCFQASSRCWQNSVPWGFRIEVPGSLWLSNRHSAPKGSPAFLATWSFPQTLTAIPSSQQGGDQHMYEWMT